MRIFLERIIGCINLSINPNIFQSFFQELPHSTFPRLCTWTEEGSCNASQHKVQRKAQLKAEQTFQPSAFPSQSFGFIYAVDSVSNKSWLNLQVCFACLPFAFLAICCSYSLLANYFFYQGDSTSNTRVTIYHIMQWGGVTSRQKT